MTTFDVAGFPVSSPSFWPRIFWSSELMLWLRKKTTPRRETILLATLVTPFYYWITYR